MEGGSVLESIFDDESGEDCEDVCMLEFEEGELTERFSKAGLVDSFGDGNHQVNQESGQRSSKNKKKKRKKKRKRSGVGPNITDVNRFVLDVCKRMKERKPYLVWNAVGCLGVSALSDLVKEVDAIQACGGQMTADGRRSRTGGGILWNIIKSRDPNAYKEIMKKGKEFESQFKQQFRSNQNPTQSKSRNDSYDTVPQEANHVNTTTLPNVFELPPSDDRSQHEITGQQRKSVHSRIRVPVTYDDLLTGDDLKEDSNQIHA